MQTQHVVILGAGYAGQIAAGRLAQRRLPIRVTVVDASPVFVERIRLHQVMTGQRIPLRPIAALLPKGVGFLQGRAVTWDVAGRSLTVATGAGAVTLPYDRLVYALGSTVDAGRVPGVAAQAAVLGGQGDAERLGATLAALPPRARVLVVGAGLTGLEAATELAESRPDLAVGLVAPRPLGEAFAPAGAAHLDRVLARLRILVHTGAAVRALDAGVAQLDDGRTVPFDVCLWAAGFVAPPLAAAAGLPVNARGQLVVDETLRVAGHPEILAAGDAAEVRGAAIPLRMGCATAMPMGVFAAEQLAREHAGRAPRRFRFGYALRCVSLGRRDGLIQRVGPDDRPLPTVWTGRWAALVKELICRSTVFTVRAERRGIPLYRWPVPPRSSVGGSAVGSPVPAGYARVE